MEKRFSLTGRSLEILNAIIRSYIATGEPVGSKTVSQRRKDGLSPASIRNVMAELEEEGYLTHPHTSAGRVPTEKALGFYVQHLTAPRLQASDADFVDVSLRQAGTLEELMGLSSRVLAELTRQMGVVVLAPLSEAVLQHVKFLRLSEHRVLIVMVARGDAVRHRVVQLGEDILQDELDRIANYINQNFAGWHLAEARHEILRRIEDERAAYDAILRRLRLLCVQGFLSADSDARVYLEGMPNLVEMFDTERARDLLRAMEEKHKLIEILDQCMRGEMQLAIQKGAASETLCVRIGLEDASPVMKGLALIGAVCHMEAGLAGRIEVVGPTRMHYERVISAVAHIAGVFHHLAENN